MKMLGVAMALVFPLAASGPLTERIAHADPSKVTHPGNHGGAGSMNIQSYFESGSLDTNLYFFHRESIPPKSGTGPFP
jgi:hypothetical protein